MYTIKNTSQASTPGSPSNRRVINVSGTRLYPTDEMQLEELTSDVLKGLRSGDLRVHRENGARVTEETLRENGLAIDVTTKISTTSTIDGRVRKKEEVFRLVETGDAEQPENADAQSEDAESEDAESEDAQDDNVEAEGDEESGGQQSSPEEPSDESAADAGELEEDSEEASAEDSEEAPTGPQTDETENILPALREAGAIDEGVETSSDMNAKPLRTLIEEYGTGVWPDGFFEDESRVTVERALSEASGE